MKLKKIPIRQCMGCREHHPKQELLRVVKDPGGDISIDTTGKTPGRGVYICKTQECFKKIRKNRAIERNLHTSIPQDIFDKIQTMLN